MSGIPCKCGRFLAKPRASCDSGGEGYSFHIFLSDIRGDCKRCGPDVQAMREGPWWDWDAWKWPAELESLWHAETGPLARPVDMRAGLCSHP